MSDGDAQAIGHGSDSGSTASGGGGSSAQSSTPEGQNSAPNPADELVPISRVRDLQSANDKLRARLSELERQTAEADRAAEAARQATTEARERELSTLRRALLAEHAGRVVPELVAGDSPEALEASVETARAAFERAAESARAQLGAQLVPAGTPARSGPSPETLSPLAKIAEGLKQ
jgi:hypothetical protein